nr:hypothetical protein Iba_chr03cCG2460 [Ipomoea batatas]
MKLHSKSSRILNRFSIGVGIPVIKLIIRDAERVALIRKACEAATAGKRMRNECATLNSSGVRYWDLQLKEATEKAMECVHDAFKEGCHLYFIWSGFIASILTTTLKSNATLLKLGLFFLLVLGGTLKGEEGEEPIEEAGRLRSRLKKPVGSVVELSTVLNTMIDVLQSTETDLVVARNFKLTTELVEKGSIGF